jgi:hypothetical protein
MTKSRKKVESKKAEKGRKLQKVEKGEKIQYSIGKIRRKISSLRIKKVAKNSSGLFSFIKKCGKNENVENYKSWKKIKT